VRYIKYSFANSQAWFHVTYFQFFFANIADKWQWWRRISEQFVHQMGCYGHYMCISSLMRVTLQLLGDGCFSYLNSLYSKIFYSEYDGCTMVLSILHFLRKGVFDEVMEGLRILASHEIIIPDFNWMSWEIRVYFLMTFLKRKLHFNKTSSRRFYQCILKWN
jgi:hypothetical protein